MKYAVRAYVSLLKRHSKMHNEYQNITLIVLYYINYINLINLFIIYIYLYCVLTPPID